LRKSEKYKENRHRRNQKLGLGYEDVQGQVVCGILELTSGVLWEKNPDIDNRREDLVGLRPGIRLKGGYG